MRLSDSKCLIAGTLLLAIVALTSIAVADESGWTSFRNGPQNLGIAHSELPDDLELVWEIASPDGITSTPVIADGITYVGTLSGELLAIELKTGNILWKYNTIEKKDPSDFAPGFNAPLALNKTTVFGGDDFGMFHAVDRKTGKAKWKKETEAEIAGGALIMDDKVIFGSHDNHLYCMNAETGEQVWAAETHGPVNGTPTLGGQYTFTTGCDQPILRVFDVTTGEETHEVPIDDSLLIASAAVKDDILYFGTDGGELCALDWKNKNFLWRFTVPKRQHEMRASPVVTDDLVIIGSRDKHLHCVDRKSGELKWSFQTRGRVDSSPVLVGNRVYFGSADKNVYAVDINNGKEVWKYYAKQSFTGSPAVGGEYLVIGADSTDGKIYCFGKK